MNTSEGRKRFNITVVVLIILNILAIGVLVFLLISRSSTSPSTPDQPTSEQSELEKKISEISAEGETILSNEGQESAINFYQSHIDKSDNDIEKSLLYTQRAVTLGATCAESCAAQILKDVYTAEELAESGDTAFDIYYYENLYGDKDKAQQYLELARQRNPKKYVPSDAEPKG